MSDITSMSGVMGNRMPPPGAGQRPGPAGGAGHAGSPQQGGDHQTLLESTLSDYLASAGLEASDADTVTNSVISAITSTAESSGNQNDLHQRIGDAIRGALDAAGLDGEAFLTSLEESAQANGMTAPRYAMDELPASERSARLIDLLEASSILDTSA